MDGRVQGLGLPRQLPTHYLRQIGRAYASLGAIDGIGSNEQPAVTFRNDQHDVRTTLLYLLQCCTISRLLTAEHEVFALPDAMNQTLALDGTVIVNHTDTDILDLLIHHPRHDTHDDNRKHENELGQERVAPYLQEFLLYEIFEHLKFDV